MTLRFELFAVIAVIEQKSTDDLVDPDNLPEVRDDLGPVGDEDQPLPAELRWAEGNFDADPPHPMYGVRKMGWERLVRMKIDRTPGYAGGSAISERNEIWAFKYAARLRFKDPTRGDVAILLSMDDAKDLYIDCRDALWAWFWPHGRIGYITHNNAARVAMDKMSWAEADQMDKIDFEIVQATVTIPSPAETMDILIEEELK